MDKPKLPLAVRLFLLVILAIVFAGGIQNIFEMTALFGWLWTLGFFTFVLCARGLYRLAVRD